MAERVRQSHVVATDDTILPMLSVGKTQSARMWVYVGDVAHPNNVFDFTLNRGRDGPKYFLRDYRQVLLADAYGGYNGVVIGNQMTRAGCWAHARRRFIDAEKVAPEIAREAVDFIGALFRVERQAKDFSVKERLALRQAQSAPVLAKLRQKLLEWKEQLLPKHPMAEAVNYALSQWAELNVFCSDGAVPIDNNISDREMKRVVLNREKFFICWQRTRRANGGDPGQLNQHLPAARGGSAVISHAAADEPTGGEGERVVRLAARPVEDPSSRSYGKPQ